MKKVLTLLVVWNVLLTAALGFATWKLYHRSPNAYTTDLIRADLGNPDGYRIGTSWVGHGYKRNSAWGVLTAHSGRINKLEQRLGGHGVFTEWDAQFYSSEYNQQILAELIWEWEREHNPDGDEFWNYGVILDDCPNEYGYESDRGVGCPDAGDSASTGQTDCQFLSEDRPQVGEKHIVVCAGSQFLATKTYDWERLTDTFTDLEPHP